MATKAAVKKAPVATKKAPVAKKAKALVASNAAGLMDHYQDKAFIKAVRTSKIKFQRVYKSIQALNLEGNAEILAKINGAYQKEKTYLYNNVEAVINAAATENNADAAEDLG